MLANRSMEFPEESWEKLSTVLVKLVMNRAYHQTIFPVACAIFPIVDVRSLFTEVLNPEKIEEGLLDPTVIQSLKAYAKVPNELLDPTTWAEVCSVVPLQESDKDLTKLQLYDKVLLHIQNLSISPV